MESESSSNAADYTTKNSRGRRPSAMRTAFIVLGGVVVALALLPFDGAVGAWCRRFQTDGDLRLGGDLKRELEFMQQFGAVTSVVVTAAFIALLDPKRRPAIKWLLAIVLANALVLNIFKMTIGRPRPRFMDPYTFTLPWQTYTLQIDGVAQPRHAWEAWRGISSNLWSMPSSHTAAAFVLAVFLATLYPKCRWLVLIWAGLVGVCRVILGAHYPSDVVVGGVIGFATATAILARWLPGERAAHVTIGASGIPG